MEAKRNHDEKQLFLPAVEAQNDVGRRRHVRLIGTFAFVVGFVLLSFCAACLVVTLQNSAQVFELKERLQKLEKEERWHELDLEEDFAGDEEEEYYDVEETERNLLKTMGDSFKHRQRRQADERKKTTRQPNNNHNKGKNEKHKPSASAIHLNLHVRDLTTDELQHYNGEHAYIYKAWRVADWAQRERDYSFVQEKGAVEIKRKGLYFIYSQILYHNSAARSSYVIMVDNDPFIKCMESVDAVMPDSNTAAASARYKTCYVGAARILNKGQNVWIKDLYSRFVTTDSTANFFGLIKLADLEK